MKDIIEKPADITSYGKIAKTLCDEIRAGVYDGEVPFPSLTKIMKRFGISRPGAAWSVAELKRLGLVTTKKGSGTSVVKRNRTIGLVIPGVADSEFYQAIMDGIVFNCKNYGVDVIAGEIFPRDHVLRAREAVRLARHFAARRVAGVIMQPVGFNAAANEINFAIEGVLNNAKIPVVLIDYDILPPPERSHHDLVAIDNFNAGRRLALHLLDVGAKRICCFLRLLSAESVWTRYDGVDSVLKRAHGKCAARIEGEPDDEKIVAAGLRKYHPDAIVCSNDIAANNLLRTLRKLNVRVPEDIMLAGFDDVRLASEMKPSLTTIHQPCFNLATAAFQTLISRIDNPDLPSRTVLLDAPLVVRNSTKIAPAQPSARQSKR